MKRILLIVLILVGFTGIDAQLCDPYSGPNIAGGATVCISSNMNIAGLQIPSDATVIVKTGVTLSGTGDYVIHGKLIFESNASLNLRDNMNLGVGATNENPLLILGTKVAIRIGKSLTQGDVTGGGVYPTVSNQIQMSGSSILEVCAAYTNSSVTYAPITYTGSDPVKYPAYFLVKGTANGAGPGSIISNTAGINFFSPNPLNNITAGNATILSAANLPTGVTPNKCDVLVPTIRDDLPNPGFCVSGCNDNTFINADDPNTIEYDNLMGGFHATIAKLTGSQYEIWGQTTAADGASDKTIPTLITPANGYTYTGTPLRATVGSYAGSSFASIRHQFILLTTDGLYAWGNKGTVIATNQMDQNNFKKLDVPTYYNNNTVNQAMGLPTGVTPQDVKMLFGSQGTLALVTCDGQAWIMSTMGKKFADGVTENNDNTNINNTTRFWHRVSTAANTPLQDVVSMRGTPYAMMALTSKGEVYTWGTGAYLGDGNARTNVTYATKMTLPSVGFTPKMIGMTYSSDHTSCIKYNHRGRCTDTRTVDGGVTYYVLGTNNQLYSLGNNAQRQLGVSAGQNDATYVAESKSWVMPIKGDKNGNSTGKPFDNIAWFSPNEHDGAGNAAINVITVDKDMDGTLHHYLYAWGSNDGSMTGTSGDMANPTFMPGQLKTQQNIIAVATGGHISIAIQECETNYGYVGHRTNGSMGDGTETNEPGVNKYNFADTAVLQLCGAAVAPKLNGFVTICPGTKINLNTDVFIGKIPAGASLVWYTTATRDAGTKVDDPTAVSAGHYWAFYEGFVTCGTPPGSEATITEYVLNSPDYKANCACFVAPTLDGTGQPTQVGISLLQRAGSTNGNWPMNRKSGFIALESNTKGFVPTRMSTAQINAITAPVDGMMVYDTNDNCLKIYTSGSWKCFDKPACP